VQKPAWTAPPKAICPSTQVLPEINSKFAVIALYLQQSFGHP
jgi:hypothetical protein